MEIKDIQALMEIVNQSDLTDLVLEQKEVKITLKKALAEPLNDERIYESGFDIEDVLAENETKSDIIDVKSHHIGKLYYAKGLATGKHISEGDVIAKIKALGVLTDVRSAVTGKISEMVVEDASIVGYGDVIIKVEVEGA